MTTTTYLIIMAALALGGTVAVVALSAADRRQKQECAALPPLPRPVRVPLPPAPQLKLVERSPFAPKPRRSSPNRDKLIGVFLQAKLDRMERWPTAEAPTMPKAANLIMPESEPSTARALLPSIDWGLK